MTSEGPTALFHLLFRMDVSNVHPWTHRSWRAAVEAVDVRMIKPPDDGLREESMD